MTIDLTDRRCCFCGTRNNLEPFAGLDDGPDVLCADCTAKVVEDLKRGALPIGMSTEEEEDDPLFCDRCGEPVKAEDATDAMCADCAKIAAQLNEEAWEASERFFDAIPEGRRS